MAGRPTWIFFTAGLVAVLLPCFAIFGWSFTMLHSKQAVAVSSRDLKDSQGRLFSDIKDLSNAVFPINATTLKLSRRLSSSNFSSFVSIEKEVGQKLFSALSTLPHLSQISYIGVNGLLLSYYIKSNKIHALFSNRTVSSNNSSEVPWYTQPVNDAGKRYGNTTTISSRQHVVQSTWFSESLNSTNGYASIGYGWAKDQEPLILFAAPLRAAQGPHGVLSLGIVLKAVSSFIRSIDIHGGYLYLAVKDGVTVAESRIPNTRLIVHNGTVSLQTTRSDNSTVDFGSPVAIPCQLDHLGSDGKVSSVSNVKIHGNQYVMHCAGVEIVGVQAVSVLAFPRNQLEGFVLWQNKITLLVLLLLLVYLLAVVVFFVFWLQGIWNKVVVQRAALIKQNEATQQSERKSMNKSYAFASASHDVRTALAAIIGLIDLSRNRVSSDSELEANLSQMNTCALNLLGILNTVLDTSKIEAGKMQLDEEEFDMAKVLEEIVDMFYVVGNKKGLEIIWDHCDGSIMKLPLVRGDCGRFKQVLCNLLSNAVKFTTEGHVVLRAWARKPRAEKLYINTTHEDSFLKFLGHLPWLTHKNRYVEEDVVSLRKVEDNPNRVEIVFEVDDSGKGIPKEKHKSVFENFVQVKEETVGAHEGTGLGLGIVQSLVRLMGGEIGIVDKDPSEKGTCFRFNVCLATSEHLRPTLSGEVNTELSNHPGTPLSARSAGDSSRSAKGEAIHAVVMISGAEASRISIKWMERQGMKVWPVRRVSHLKANLDKLKQNLRLTDVASGTATSSESTNSNSSTSYIREATEDATIGTEDAIHSPSSAGRDYHHKGGGSSSTQISTPLLLVVVDMGSDSFKEICSVLKSFGKNVEPSRYRVVWLANPDTPSDHVNFLKSKQAPSDSILQKPFHGSRLTSVLKILYETGTEASVEEEGPSQATETSSQVLEAKKEIKEGPLQGVHVLVVEDNDLLLMLTVRIVTRFGASYETARNGEEAVNLVRRALTETKAAADGSSKSFPYDVVLMDCEMPLMDGFTATRVIRKEEKWYGRHIPIVALTAHASSEKVEKCFEAGMDGHLVKPLKPEKLLETVLSFVTHSK